jgi:NDP-sugar pyrophosphorylase family protein
MTMALTPTLISAGVYLFHSSSFRAPVTACSFEKDLVPKMIANGATVSAIAFNGTFIDIGTPEGYASICKLYESPSD